MAIKLPRMIRVRQSFQPTARIDVPSTIRAEVRRLGHEIRPGASVAVGVGSRGITQIATMVATIIDELKVFGASPFIVPAMGSHGGATPHGQLEVLATYGITESSMRVPIRSSMDVVEIGKTSDGVPVFCSKEALAADAILLINRIKPHTDFFGDLGSGLLKMSVIGLGKHSGATAMHLAATQFGYERAIRSMAKVLIDKTRLVGGIAVIENQFHETAKILAVPSSSMDAIETSLLNEAKALMPRLPFDEIDLLIVDEIGKNISGTGMDPNVINRSIHGYDSLPMRGDRTAPFIRRIFVRDLSEETHGNAIGIGMADATTLRLIDANDPNKTNVNALTALTPQSAKLPIAFATDREAIERMLVSLPLKDTMDAKIVHIADTLSVATMEISETLWNQCTDSKPFAPVSAMRPMEFSHDQNLHMDAWDSL